MVVSSDETLPPTPSAEPSADGENTRGAQVWFGLSPPAPS